MPPQMRCKPVIAPIIFTLLLAFSLTVPSHAQEQGMVVTLAVRQEKTIDLPNLSDRIVVDRPDLVSLFMPDPKKLSITGLEPGLADISIRTEDGTTTRIFVKVQPTSPELLDKLAVQIRAYFQDVPSINVDVRNDRIILSGTLPPGLENLRTQVLANYGDVVIDLIQAPTPVATPVSIAPQAEANPATPPADPNARGSLEAEAVRVDVQVVEVARDVTDDLGIEWFANGPWNISGQVGANGSLDQTGVLNGTLPSGASTSSTDSLSSTLSSASSLASGANTSSASSSPTSSNTQSGFGQSVSYNWGATGSVSLQNLQFNLIALERAGKARMLATPRLIVESGKKADFLVGGEVPVVSTTALTSTTEYKKFGTQLQIAPEIRSASTIFINLTATISNLDFGRAVNGQPTIVTKEATTNVTLHNGKTLAIAGLISRQQGIAQSKVPVLGDIPLLGHLFKRDTDTINDTETMIFITPFILRTLDVQGHNPNAGEIPLEFLNKTQQDIEQKLQEEIIQPELDKQADQTAQPKKTKPNWATRSTGP